jgi:excisionase family DNA binding protein
MMARRHRYVEEPLLVSVQETARLLGIGERLAWDLVYAGEIKTIRLGRRVLIPRTVVEQIAGKYDETNDNTSRRLDRGASSN